MQLEVLDHILAERVENSFVEEVMSAFMFIWRRKVRRRGSTHRYEENNGGKIAKRSLLYYHEAPRM